MERRESVTREANAGLKWQDKFHPMGRISNHMNGLTYQPQWPPDESSLQNQLSPLHRSEVVEVLTRQGIHVPETRLNWGHYYLILKRRPTDPYDGTKLKAEWETQYPEMKAENDRAWGEFLERFENAKG